VGRPAVLRHFAPNALCFLLVDEHLLLHLRHCALRVRCKPVGRPALLDELAHLLRKVVCARRPLPSFAGVLVWVHDEQGFAVLDLHDRNPAWGQVEGSQNLLLDDFEANISNTRECEENLGRVVLVVFEALFRFHWPRPQG
jgi:hypothetical protein